MPELADDGLLARRQRLYWTFNFLPSSYCDESWLPAGLNDQILGRRLNDEHPCHRYLSPWLLRRFGLEQQFDLELGDSRSRIALLPRDALDRLALMLGLVSCQDTLRKTVQPQFVRDLKASCCLDNLGVLLSTPARLRIRPLPGMPQIIGDDDLPGLQEQGRWFVWSLMADESKAVKKRFRLKYPQQPAARRWPHAQRLVSRDETPQLAAWAVERLIPEALPQWAWLF